MVVFPSLVNGERFKLVCIMLRGFKSHRYHIPSYEGGSISSVG